MAEGVGRAFGAAAAARTASPAPFGGQERSPRSPPASLRFPPPPALPRATAPAARRAKLTYLEPDKQEPLRPGSQSPPRVTGPPQPMGAAVTSLYGQSSCAPVSGHLEASANGHERKAAQPAGPQPPPPPPPWRRGAADWPGPRRVGLGLPAGRACADPGGGRGQGGCVGRGRRPRDPVPGPGGVPKSCCLRGSLGSCSPLLQRVPRAGGWERGRDAPEADGGVTGNFGRLAGPCREVARPGVISWGRLRGTTPPIAAGKEFGGWGRRRD